MDTLTHSLSRLCASAYTQEKFTHSLTHSLTHSFTHALSVFMQLESSFKINILMLKKLGDITLVLEIRHKKKSFQHSSFIRVYTELFRRSKSNINQVLSRLAAKVVESG